MLQKLTEVLQHMENQHTYAEDDIRWFAAVSWNQGSGLVNKGQFKRGESFLGMALRFYQHCKSEKTAAIIEVCREDYIKVVERLDASQKENMVIN